MDAFNAMRPGDWIICRIIIALYFLPSIVAIRRDVDGKTSIILINLFFGWTFVVWAGCLMWAHYAHAWSQKNGRNRYSARSGFGPTTEQYYEDGVPPRVTDLDRVAPAFALQMLVTPKARAPRANPADRPWSRQ
jgi:Superinfection immunity protein